MTTPERGPVVTIRTALLSVPVHTEHVDQVARLHTMAEPTDVPGVVITPAINHGGGFTGGWTLTHARTGFSLGAGDHPLAWTRETVELLPRDVDWTVDRTELVALPELGVRIHKLRRAVLDARAAGRPLWWARSSWRCEPPQYLVDDTPFDTWAALLADVDRDDEYVRQVFGDRDRVVTRTAPGWSLWCAAPGCTNYFDDCEGWGPCRGERRELAAYARAEDWTRHDARHWLCATCASTHPAESAYASSGW